MDDTLKPASPLDSLGQSLTPSNFSADPVCDEIALPLAKAPV